MSHTVAGFFFSRAESYFQGQTGCWEELFVWFSKEDGERGGGSSVLRVGGTEGMLLGILRSGWRIKVGRAAAARAASSTLFSSASGDQKSFASEAGTGGGTFWRTP